MRPKEIETRRVLARIVQPALIRYVPNENRNVLETTLVKVNKYVYLFTSSTKYRQDAFALGIAVSAGFIVYHSSF